MEEKKINEAANRYAWANDTIGINKNDFSRVNQIDDMVRIPISDEIKSAFIAGAKFSEKEMIEMAVEILKEAEAVGFGQCSCDFVKAFKEKIEK